MRININQLIGFKPTYFLITILLFCLSGCAVVPPNIHVPKVPPKPIIPKNVEVALVLGAGGSRAFTHLGILEVLEEEGIPIDLIVGCSAGSIVGALYADNPNAQALKRKVIKLRKKDLLDGSYLGILLAPFRLTGYVQGNALEKFLLKEMCARDFKDLKIPLVAVSTNVDHNHIVALSSGPIAPAVHASSALPPVFTPVCIYNQTLVDGGVISPVPVSIARRYKPKLVIAVDISTPPSCHPLTNAFELLYRSLHISFYELSRLQTTKADIVLHPNLEGYGTFEDQYNEQLYEKGKETARAAIKNIKKALESRGIQLRKR